MHLKKIINTAKSLRESLRVPQETLVELSDVGLRTLEMFESGMMMVHLPFSTKFHG